jgi:bifunctional ADP-heptose synthase (sugar kinase/adenylyltransferase)
VRTAESKIASLDDASRHVASARAAGKRVALASGSFEVLHAAETRWLDAARAGADVLVVAVTSDAALVPDHDRAELVAAVRAVDHVVVVPARQIDALVERLRPDTHRRANDAETRALFERLRA